MTFAVCIRHEFVEFIPDELDPGVLYVSMGFATASHLCCCGCGLEVVTPISPRDWRLTFDGEAISLQPSIGNWSFPCRSHYWITGNSIRKAEHWSTARISSNREADMALKDQHFGATKSEETSTDGSNEQSPSEKPKGGFFRRIGRWLRQE